MANNKHQHWVPSCYLMAWADPNKPANYDPFVHIFDRTGGNHTKRAPQNAFHMPDLYTVFEGDKRNLRIEKSFAAWEYEFVRVRSLIEADHDVSGDDAAKLYAFVAAMMARPPHRIDFIKGQWSAIVDKARSIRINTNVAPMPSLSEGPSMTLDEAQELADDPMGTWFADHVASHISVLSKMFGCDVFVNESQYPFLTSDDPAVIYYPPRKPGRRMVPRGLGSPGCEITIALSPRIALLFRHKEPGIHSFLRADWETVLEFNFRTITRARERIISDRPDLFFVKTILELVARTEG
jgi:Protein of unknown function (DUF4238)